MEAGFYLVRLGEREFEVCKMRDGPNTPFYVQAKDSLPIPWEELDRLDGKWMPAYLEAYSENAVLTVPADMEDFQ